MPARGRHDGLPRLTALTPLVWHARYPQSHPSRYQPHITQRRNPHHPRRPIRPTWRRWWLEFRYLMPNDREFMFTSVPSWLLEIWYDDRPAASISWSLVGGGAGDWEVMKDAGLKRRFLYHMLEWRYAKRIFESNKLRLSPVRSWQDPYERWWCDRLFYRPGPLSGFQPYGSCWTIGARDEPRWRMAGFGPDKETPIVRIRSRVDAMVNATTSLLKNNGGAAFLGRVQYRGERALLDLAQSVAEGPNKEVTRMAATMLLHKRRAFKFEDEVRLLWLDKQTLREGVYIDIEAKTFIDQVMITPHASPAETAHIKREMEPFDVLCLASGLLNSPL